MPEVLDWQQGDPRLASQRAVDELKAGRLVVFPTDTGYHLAASALNAEALLALVQLVPAEEAVLAVRSVADALLWAPWMSATAQRLARRCWPGPLTLVIDNPPDATLAGSPGHFANGQGTIRLRVPAHEAPLLALDQLGGPVVFAPAPKSCGTIEELSAALGDSVALLLADGPPSPSPSPSPSASTATSGELAATVVHVRGSEWSVAQTGSITAEMLQALMPTTIVFVCTGNTCRSPLAEALCKKLLAERLGCQPSELPARGFVVLSAGLAAMMGAAATPEAAAAAQECGADLGTHQSQPLTASLLARADHLFTMTQSHLRALLPFCDTVGTQPRMLAPDAVDVPDPIGCEQEVYRACAQQILRHLHECLPEILPR